MSKDFNGIAFYLVGYKGHKVLKSFIDKYGSSAISFVVCGSEAGTRGDYLSKISELCITNSIIYFDINSPLPSSIKKFTGWKFAVGWKRIISNKSKLIVLHDSLLPKYRGFAPLVNALISGEKKVGVTAIMASDDYDKGDIIDKEEINVCYPIKIYDLMQSVTPLYSILIFRIYELINNKFKISTSSQVEEDATYSIWLNEQDYFINWEWSSEKIKRFIDATGYPYDHARSILNGKVVKFVDSLIVDDVYIEDRDRHIGKVIFMKGDMPILICGSGLLMISSLLNNHEKKIKINFRSKFENYE